MSQTEVQDDLAREGDERTERIGNAMIDALSAVGRKNQLGHTDPYVVQIVNAYMTLGESKIVTLSASARDSEINMASMRASRARRLRDVDGARVQLAQIGALALAGLIELGETSNGDAPERPEEGQQTAEAPEVGQH